MESGFAGKSQRSNEFVQDDRHTHKIITLSTDLLFRAHGCKDKSGLLDSTHRTHTLTFFLSFTLAPTKKCLLSPRSPSLATARRVPSPRTQTSRSYRCGSASRRKSLSSCTVLMSLHRDLSWMRAGSTTLHWDLCLPHFTMQVWTRQRYVRRKFPPCTKIGDGNDSNLVPFQERQAHESEDERMSVDGAEDECMEAEEESDWTAWYNSAKVSGRVGRER